MHAKPSRCGVPEFQALQRARVPARPREAGTTSLAIYTDLPGSSAADESTGSRAECGDTTSGTSAFIVTSHANCCDFSVVVNAPTGFLSRPEVNELRSEIVVILWKQMQPPLERQRNLGRTLRARIAAGGNVWRIIAPSHHLICGQNTYGCTASLPCR
jgi:hypothetical protein